MGIDELVLLLVALARFAFLGPGITDVFLFSFFGESGIDFFVEVEALLLVRRSGCVRGLVRLRLFRFGGRLAGLLLAGVSVVPVA